MKQDNGGHTDKGPSIKVNRQRRRLYEQPRAELPGPDMIPVKNISRPSDKPEKKAKKIIAKYRNWAWCPYPWWTPSPSVLCRPS